MDIGAELRAAREAKGLSIRTIAERTRVQPRTLAAIELNNLAALPPRPFGRGFVRAFAQEVDLDPDRTVHSYFAQFPHSTIVAAPAVARSFDRVDTFAPRASQWTGLGTAAAILIVVVTAAIVAGRRGETPRDSGAVGTSGTTTAPRASTSTAPPAVAGAGAKAATAAAPSAAVPSAVPLRLAFTVSRPCWIAASIDGKRVLYRILEPGERHTLDAQREVAIRFGDAGAVAWTINGREGASLGAAGAVRNLRITPDNAATVR